MEETLKFSILVPVYQVEKYIDDCIQSVLNQTYTNWELILVDDGTKDNSGIICDRYAEKYPHIHVYHKENRGLIHTRRYAIARATGDYYVFLDSDDMLKPHALQTISENLQKYHCDCLIYGYDRLVGNKLRKGSDKETECCMTDKREIYRKCFMGDYNALWRKAVRADVFRERIDYSPYYHLQIAEDLLQSIEILKNSRSVAFIEDRLYHYRVNPSSIMQSMKAGKTYRVDYTIFQTVLDFWNTEAVFSPEDIEEYRGYCLWKICADVYNICGLHTSYRHKKQILQEIKETEYFHNVIDAGYDKKRLGLDGKVVSFFFLRNWEGILIYFFCPAYRFLRRL